MSEKILIDVDQRINSIKNSLKEIHSNIDLTTSRDPSFSSSSKKHQKPSNKSSPKSGKKPAKLSYVSNYVAFGNTEESESSSEELISPKKLTFDPTATEIFSKNLEFKGETISKESYFQDLSDLQHQITSLKEKNLALESNLNAKEQEIINLLNSQEILKKHLDLKTKNLDDNEKIVESLKSEIINLNLIISKYQTAMTEFENFHKDYEVRKDEKNKNFEGLEIKIQILQDEVLLLNEKLLAKESELQNLNLTNRELERENNHFSKFIKKSKEKSNVSSEKKIKDEIRNLKQINENLREELKKRPNDLVLKETEKKLIDLEKIVSEHCGKKNGVSDKKVLGSLMVLLKAQKTSDVLVKVQDLVKASTGSKFELSRKLKNLIIRYSPPGSFQKLPNDRKILAWIKRLIEEYLLKVKQEEFNMKNLDALKKCMKSLNVTFTEDLICKIEDLKNKVN